MHEAKNEEGDSAQSKCEMGTISYMHSQQFKRGTSVINRKTPVIMLRHIFRVLWLYCVRNERECYTAFVDFYA